MDISFCLENNVRHSTRDEFVAQEFNILLKGQKVQNISFPCPQYTFHIRESYNSEMFKTMLGSKNKCGLLKNIRKAQLSSCFPAKNVLLKLYICYYRNYMAIDLL